MSQIKKLFEMSASYGNWKASPNLYFFLIPSLREQGNPSKNKTVHLYYFLLRKNAPKNGKLLAVFIFSLTNFN